ncbi:MAG: GlsB/YeaQ/YmgE family stress response membrane protein [Spirochaetales bacterium]|nr:GlsB/YeaQ/YmgE family stress response membrane protein [Spirochaetales bacterium]
MKLGLVLTVLLGLFGSLLATYLGQQWGWYAGAEKAGIPAAVLGAVVILLAVRFFKNPA